MSASQLRLRQELATATDPIRAEITEQIATTMEKVIAAGAMDEMPARLPIIIWQGPGLHATASANPDKDPLNPFLMRMSDTAVEWTDWEGDATMLDIIRVVLDRLPQHHDVLSAHLCAIGSTEYWTIVYAPRGKRKRSDWPACWPDRLSAL